MLVLIRYEDRRGNLFSKVLEPERIEELVPLFWQAAGWGARMLWYLPQCGKERW